MKIASWLKVAALGSVVSLAACSFQNSRIAGADIPFAKADYKLGGKVSDEACGVYIFAIWWKGIFTADTGHRAPRAAGGNPLAFLSGRNTKEENRALYQSLQKMPDATHLTDVRAEESFKGFGGVRLPLFGKRCAKVTSQAVTMGDPLQGQVQP